MITDRDREIILHLEKYKYATIEQLQKIFFREQIHSYSIVRRRMKEIIKADYARAIRDIETNKIIYVYNDGKIKQPDRHRLILLNILANLHSYELNVKTYEIEKFWQGGRIRSDAIAVFTLDNAKRRYQYFIEVQTSNSEINLEKYDKLYETGEVQGYLGRNVYPRILVISDREIKHNVKSTEVVQVNTRLDGLASIILPPNEDTYSRKITNI